jgi:hypothetical protein
MYTGIRKNKQSGGEFKGKKRRGEFKGEVRYQNLSISTTDRLE